VSFTLFRYCPYSTTTVFDDFLGIIYDRILTKLAHINTNMSATSITTATTAITATAATAATSDDMGSLMIELIDIGETSPVTDGLLHFLQDVYNDAGKYPCHDGTTHIIVLYDNDKVVGGALLRISSCVIVIKRLCIGVENLRVLEIRSNAPPTTLSLSYNTMICVVPPWQGYLPASL
jgi:hypothetical protein